MPFLLSEMAPAQIWSAYIRYIGAGAVLCSGLITLARTLPTIVASARGSLKDLSAGAGATTQTRTERDIPMGVVLIGSLLLGLFLAFSPGLPTQGNVLAAVLILIFGFFFATVSSRITGLIGTSSNPISGMTIATLILTCLLFVGLGWTGDMYSPIAICVGAIVCIAAANAGNTSQDLKTGYIVGATPLYQQIGLVIGVVTSAFIIGGTLLYLHENLGGIGSQNLAAPQATLMSTIIRGLLNQNLPWGLVLVGVFVAVVLELCGIRSLPFAVGSYLPIATTAPIFCGGLVRWWVEHKSGQSQESDVSSGTLFSSGLIAGGSIAGILFALLVGTNEWSKQNLGFGAIDAPNTLGVWFPYFSQPTTVGQLASFALFGALALIVARVGLRKVQ
jgi:putative OPT family oligopeptide transporter